MSKKCCNSNQLEACGCPTPRMCCGSMAVPTTAYQMVSVPQMVYDNVPASQVSPFAGSPYGVSPYGDGGENGFGCSWIIIILLLLFCCNGNGFGGCDDGDFGGSWIIIILLLLFCCGGNGFGC